LDTTLLKGLGVLEALAARGQPCGVSELSTELQLSKSNTHRLLNTLVAAGFATLEDSRYTASLKAWELGVRIIENYDVRRVARPVMKQVAKVTSEGVRLAILDTARLESVVVDAIESSHVVRTFIEIASRVPAYCTASGKALLAHQDAATIARCCRKLRPLTRWTITDPAEFVRNLEDGRRDGFVTSLREYSDQVRSVGAPIFAPDGAAIASISIAAPAERMTAAVIRDFAQTLCAAAQKITASMQSTANVAHLYRNQKRGRAGTPSQPAASVPKCVDMT
jgi:DNA-binding IclR family transcriptional regulator